MGEREPRGHLLSGDWHVEERGPGGREAWREGARDAHPSPLRPAPLRAGAFRSTPRCVRACYINRLFPLICYLNRSSCISHAICSGTLHL